MHRVPSVRTLSATVLQDARHLVAMARAALTPGLNEPLPSAAGAKRNIARDAPMGHNQHTGSVSKQGGRVDCPDKSTSTASTGGGNGIYGGGVGYVSTISTVGSGGSDGREAGSTMASTSQEQEREVSTASSKAGRRLSREGGLGSSNRPYLPLHGFISFISDLHMKTPQEILEKVKQRPQNIQHIVHTCICS